MLIKNALPSKVRIVEVGARDGLQNEATPLTVEDKVQLVNQLSQTGLQHIEVGSFVSPKWVPQMANSDQVFANIERQADVRYAALTPNMKGFDAALAANCGEVAIFAAASEAFSQKNINCSIKESVERFAPIMQAAVQAKLPVRGYVSCVLGCPYEGDVAIEKVKEVSALLLDMGCYEVSLGDTIGVGTPMKTQMLLEYLLQDLAPEQLAVHFHDTYGQALANILVALQSGISVVDSSVAGLGGCPYAKGASGNVATEDVLYMLKGLGIETGVDLPKLAEVGQLISDQLNRVNGAKAGRAIIAKNG